ncbi:hypothetical protein LTR10_020297 [Elasticomyces elasticus]|uniref:RING-type domain-containing protein n=1 Tax=Exophiala sideris TaxID=1016849 RepID=A0ABR0J7P9_9EURO|nr:hypothetical protein LTR10_020297 [Elasticomyces elasticus]KAK5029954.1 hypothetical protein LTS07_005678 [Exophiala sideris]KAK5031606.1 hypothetical protein LTR13_007595 [Exophiala sideris]KAK5058284.1 hypothetical protein LTR69_006688 [Exophiala sideris]KAK5180213.1 hypothetical protein LTR44_007338 [Eurotiomycetes sp. CCFEE 6388]
MAGQGPTSLTVQGVLFDPTTSLGDIERHFSASEGYLSTTIQRTRNDPRGRVIQDFVFNFATAADAAYSLIAHPEIRIAGRSYPVVPHDGDFGDPQYHVTEPVRPSIIAPRKRAKTMFVPDTPPVCKICFCEFPHNEPYSTPCRRCKEPCCYNCLKEDFQHAMNNMTRFPVKCCSTVVHHEVARGILSAAELEIYKSKMDEMNDVNPLYCPIPTCSTFIPRRMFRADATKVNCHVCQATICPKCKQLAAEDHSCVSDAGRELIIDTFDYRPCPRCGTGVMRMYGCDHIRCRCSAHWCWACGRAVKVCRSKPCSAAREDGVESAGEEEGDVESVDEPRESIEQPAMVDPADNNETLPEEDHDPTLRATTIDHTNSPGMAALLAAMEIQNANLDRLGALVAEIGQPLEARLDPGPFHGTNSTESGPGQAAPSTPTDNVPEAVIPESNEAEPSVTAPANLDDPYEIDWEVRSVDFGEEPNDENWDVWGCTHHFRDLAREDVPKNWLVGVDPLKDEVVEVECMTCFEKARLSDGSSVKKKDEERDKGAEDAENAARKKSPEKGVAREKQAFECTRCGVVVCRSCKNIARKRIKKARQATDGWID